MTSFRLLLTLIKVAFIIGAGFVDAFPNGAPAYVCDSMKPDPNVHGPQLDPVSFPCPFVTQSDKVEILSGEILEIRIESINATQFAGFLLMARDEHDETVGEFLNITNGKTLDCFKGIKNAITHGDNTRKSFVSALWRSPLNFDGTVTFYATYVQEFKKFWVKQQSVQVHVIKDAPTSTAQPGTTTDTLPTTPSTSLFRYEDCGKSKGCFVMPSGCQNRADCKIATSYRQISPSVFEFEIYGTPSGVNSYVAMAFSKDNHMNDDSVIECNNYGAKLTAYMSHNYMYDNRRWLHPLDNLQLIGASYSDGHLYCCVRRISNWTDEGITYDLNQAHFVLMSMGPASEDNIKEHSDRAASGKEIDFTEFGFDDVVYSRTLKKCHGSLMVLAWLMCASMGVFLPRYMKRTWIGKAIMGKDVWFSVHLMLMSTTWLLTIVAFILIFVDIGGWVPGSIAQNAHPIIGCITTALSFIQPLMAMARPLPASPKRYIFNWAHSTVGYCAHILAITCIFLAVGMHEAKLPYFTYWILTGHVTIYILTHNILHLISKWSQQCAKSGEPKEAKAAHLTKVVFALYGTSIAAIAITVVVLIAIQN